MLRTSRFLALACLAGALLAAPARAEDMRLGHDVVPTFQTISLRLDAGTTSYTGTTGIDLQVKQPTNQFRFHAEGVTLDKLHFSGPKGPIELTTTTGEKGLVTATLNQSAAPGAYRLDIEFHDTFNTDAVGLYRMENDGRAYAFSQFEADDAREAFPCWDEPSFKIPFQIILSVPEGQVAVANTLPEKETVENGWKTTVFRTTKPLPSYLLNIATGDLETVEIPGLSVPGRVVTVKGGKAAWPRRRPKPLPPFSRRSRITSGRPIPTTSSTSSPFPSTGRGRWRTPARSRTRTTSCSWIRLR